MQGEEEKQERIRRYLSGSLPLEEVQALEAEMAADPGTALAVQLCRLEEQDPERLEETYPEPEINGWLPGIKALQGSGNPLWALSLLAATMVIGMAGARSRRSGRRYRMLTRPLASQRQPPPGGLATDSEPEPSEGG